MANAIDFLGGGLLGGATNNPFAGVMPLAAILGLGKQTPQSSALPSLQSITGNAPQQPGASPQQMQNSSPAASSAINAGPQGPPATSANVSQAGAVPLPPVGGGSSLSDALSKAGAGADLAKKVGGPTDKADFMTKAMPWLMALQALHAAGQKSRTTMHGSEGGFAEGGSSLL